MIRQHVETRRTPPKFMGLGRVSCLFQTSLRMPLSPTQQRKASVCHLDAVFLSATASNAVIDVPYLEFALQPLATCRRARQFVQQSRISRAVKLARDVGDSAQAVANGDLMVEPAALILERGLRGARSIPKGGGGAILSRSRRGSA